MPSSTEHGGQRSVKPAAPKAVPSAEAASPYSAAEVVAEEQGQSVAELLQERRQILEEMTASVGAVQASN